MRLLRQTSKPSASAGAVSAIGTRSAGRMPWVASITCARLWRTDSAASAASSGRMWASPITTTGLPPWPQVEISSPCSL